MTILVQHCQTLEYLTPRLGWSQLLAEAQVFASSPQALNCCLSNRLDQVQIVLKFERDEFDVRLPILQSGCRTQNEQSFGA